ncbi:MAG: HTTM domain-containing protein [Planctomycetaceae bacterium]
MTRTATSSSSGSPRSTATNTAAGSWHALAQKLFEPVDIDFLVYFRVLFGAVMTYQVLSYFGIAGGGRTYVEEYYIRPFHFHYFGFDWVKPWPGNGMTGHFAALGILAAGIAIGFLYRISSVLFCLGWVYVFLLDKAYFQNHYYLVCLLTGWMAIVPAHRSFSLDAALRPNLQSSTVPAWILWVLRLQLGIPYFFGGIAKINPDWLQGEPMRSWIYGGRYSYIPDALRNEATVYAFAYGGMLFDLLIVPMLLWRRTRWIACAAAIYFHLSNHFVYPIGIFPWLMLGSLALYFPPGTIRRLLGAWPIDDDRKDAVPHVGLSGARKLFVGFLVVVFAFQAVWPLRQFLYPGDAGWTGEGDLFAWRMMLYNKKGVTPVFEIVDPTGKTPTEQIDARRFLNAQQAWSMQLNPDLLLQFAHFLHREILEPRGLGRMQVRVRAPVRYNMRKPQLIVDPNVDLAATERTAWGRADWILPLTEPLPSPASYRTGENIPAAVPDTSGNN